MILANLNENLTTSLILKNTTNLDSIAHESILLKGGCDYDDCCCGDTCSCGYGHKDIGIPESSDMFITDNTIIVNDINSIAIENLTLGQSDMNIPLIFLRIGIVFLIGLLIEVFNALGAINIKNKSKSFICKKDNNKSGPKFLDAPVS
jgi:hypothetical protein